ncbi:MAG: trypsin-like serine protease [bacterium]|nr:trypsin-like serine protease [bacterium]
MKRILSLISIVSVLFSCGGGGSDAVSDNAVTICPRIINGESCSGIGSPIVEIEITSANGTVSLCSGSVITSNQVLTAAHCFAFTKVVKVDVVSDTTKFSVSKFSFHPDLGQSGNALFNDVAIVQTRKSLNLPTLPLVLSQTVEKGDQIGINGYGLDAEGNLGNLKGGSMTVSNITVNHVEAAFDGDGSNTCNGDSGGPATLTIGNTVGIVGLTSTGLNPKCQAGDVTLFTNTQSQSVLDYITSIAPDIATL